MGVGSYSWFVLLILASIYAQQQWSRYSLNYLYNVSADDDKTSIAEADHISYANYGILTGYGFSATFCIAGLFAGRAADIMSRRLIVFSGVAIWNAALFMIGYSTNFALVLCWRLVLGLGQAFSNPASYSLIADYFPEEKRAMANGLFACGVYIGGGLASLCISMANGLGWRATCFLIAVVGFILAAVEGLFVKEPARGSNKKAAQEPDKPKRSFEDALRTIFSNRLVVLVFAASSLRFMGGYAIAGYLPTFYGIVFPSYDDQYSFINAYVVASGGFLSSWLGGMIADEWRRTEVKARMYLPACGCFFSLPFIAVCCLAPNFYVSILIGLFLEYLVAECWFGPVVATMQSALPPDCRALAIACFTLLATFFGSLASYLIGVVYDLLLANGYSPKIIQWIVLWSVVISYSSSGALFVYGAALVPSDQPTLASPANEAKPLLKKQEPISASDAAAENEV
ncbi:hypothetical protein CTAYLR_004936 [Chrysophaeum taylorii]|uniref:Major facilitator superfamily (MFS) profile domain-containing protein n=1 Tax=Chrysophaeum taylorii TaxID=2483200 RepID=A0AAD7UQ79_9STRA|nr:hypothetical protein CTAYLR_004936 [Chrysophaeum taylorii]